MRKYGIVSSKLEYIDGNKAQAPLKVLHKYLVYSQVSHFSLVRTLRAQHEAFGGTSCLYFLGGNGGNEGNEEFVRTSTHEKVVGFVLSSVKSTDSHMVLLKGKFE